MLKVALDFFKITVKLGKHYYNHFLKKEKIHITYKFSKSTALIFSGLNTWVSFGLLLGWKKMYVCVTLLLYDILLFYYFSSFMTFLFD